MPGDPWTKVIVPIAVAMISLTGNVFTAIYAKNLSDTAASTKKCNWVIRVVHGTQAIEDARVSVVAESGFILDKQTPTNGVFPFSIDCPRSPLEAVYVDLVVSKAGFRTWRTRIPISDKKFVDVNLDLAPQSPKDT